MEVDDLLQKHSLQEADITVQAERVETLNTAALKFTTIEGIYILMRVFTKSSEFQGFLYVLPVLKTDMKRKLEVLF